jgi:tRNA 2-thiouridine synthesizing protein A
VSGIDDGAGLPGADDGRDVEVVDARGLACPVPVIRLAQHARDAAPGTVVEVWATDPAAAADVPAWCRMRGQGYLGARSHTGADGTGWTAYRVRVGDASPTAAVTA